MYECGVLHRMLGATPLVSLAAKSSRRPESKSVESAWGEVDMEVESDEEGVVSTEDEEDGRYEIGRRKQPPKKRPRPGTRTADERAVETVYTTDDDESVTHQPDGDGDGVSEEEAEYDLPNIDGANQEMDGGKLAAANRRSYWLSKGVVTGADDSGDD